MAAGILRRGDLRSRAGDAMVTTEPDWKELYTDARATIILRDAEIHLLRNSLDIVRERESVTAMLAFGAGGVIGFILAWLVLI